MIIASFVLAAEHVLRMDPIEDKEGFFIALFVRRKEECGLNQLSKLKRQRQEMPLPFTRLSKMWLLSMMMSSSSGGCGCCSGDTMACHMD